MKICVQGLWHLGSVTAASLSSLGHQVLGLDLDSTTVDKLIDGKAPIYEPGLDEMIKSGIDENLLSFESQVSNIHDIELLWVTYDTPVDDEDKADVEFVKDQIKSVLPKLANNAIVIISSQMPVGSIQYLECYVAQEMSNKKINFAYSPENLRLGKAIDVFLNPDRIIVGIRDEATKLRLETFLSSIGKNLERNHS
jgi:UDPglucose 6-dehydrogenase